MRYSARRRVRLTALAVAAITVAAIPPVVFDAAPARAVVAGDLVEVRPGAGLSFQGADYAVPGLVDALFAADGVTLLTLATGPSGARLGGLQLPDLTPLPAPLVDLHGTPVALAVAPDQLAAVVATAAPDALTVVDVETGAVRQTWPLTVTPSAFVIAPNGTRAYVLSKTEHVVAIVDLATGDTIDELDAGDDPVDLTIDSNSSTLWVSDNAATPVVHRWALSTLTRTEMPLWGASAAGDLAIAPAHDMLLALDPVNATVHVASTISTSFQRTFQGFASPTLTATKLVVGMDESSVYVLTPGGFAHHDLLTDYRTLDVNLLYPDTTDLISPPSAPPKLSDHGVVGTYDKNNDYNLTVFPGVPAPTSYLWQIEGEPSITTTGPALSHHFTTAGYVPITVTALRPSPTVGAQYTGRFFFGVPGSGDSVSTGVFVDPITTIDFHTYLASEQVEYWTLPDDTYTVTIKAAGEPGRTGADAGGHNDDQSVSLGGVGAAGGNGLQVTTTFGVGGIRFVQPGDTIGIVSGGSEGNLLGGAGGDGDLNGGTGGGGGNGSGVFLKTSGSTQPWLVVAPGGGGGGGGGGASAIKSRLTYGGSGALDPDDTEGLSAQMTGSGDAGYSPGLCAPVGDEFHDGPRTADPAQNGGAGSDGDTATTAGGAGGGGAGCLGGSGGTDAKFMMGPGGGGGTAYSRYPITASKAWSQAASVTVTITRLAGAPQGAQFTSPTAQRAVAGDSSCIVLTLTGGKVGPVAISGVDWLTLTQLDEYYYAACGTPGPEDIGTATLHAEATDWNATTDVTIDVVDPAIAATDAEVPAGAPVSIPVTLSDFSRPELTASGLPPGLSYVRSSLGGTTGAIVGTVPYGNDGAWPVALKVDDKSPNGGSGIKTRDITLTVVSHPDLALTLGGDTVGQAGSPVTLDATVSNTGSDPSVGPVSVDLDLPVGLGATSLGGSGWTCVLSTGSCTHPGNLAPSTGLPAIAISATPASADTYTVHGTVGAAVDDNATNNVAEFTVNASPAPGAPPSPGDSGDPGGSGTPGHGASVHGTPGDAASSGGHGSSSSTASDTSDSGSASTSAPGSSEGNGSQSGSGSSGSSDQSESAPTTFPWWGWLVIALVLLGGLAGAVVAGRRMTDR